MLALSTINFIDIFIVVSFAMRCAFQRCENRTMPHRLHTSKAKNIIRFKIFKNKKPDPRENKKENYLPENETSSNFWQIRFRLRCACLY